MNTPGAGAAFLAARDFILKHRTDYDTAVHDFEWPSLDRFNWALDARHERPFDQLERGAWSASTSVTTAPPKHIPVPISWTRSTVRIVAKTGLPSILRKLMSPNASRTKKIRKNLRRSVISGSS
jgi:hypothetical protein